MQFERKDLRRRNITLGAGRDPELYPHNLQLYSLPPIDNISLQEFETFAVERLKGLLIWFLGRARRSWDGLMVLCVCRGRWRAGPPTPVLDPLTPDTHPTPDPPLRLGARPLR